MGAERAGVGDAGPGVVHAVALPDDHEGDGDSDQPLLEKRGELAARKDFQQVGELVRVERRNRRIDAGLQGNGGIDVAREQVTDGQHRSGRGGIVGFRE